MLKFYYDFLDRYFDCSDSELIHMDTESNYITISGYQLEDIVLLKLRTGFGTTKSGFHRTSESDVPPCCSNSNVKAAG